MRSLQKKTRTSRAEQRYDCIEILCSSTDMRKCKMSLLFEHECKLVIYSSEILAAAWQSDDYHLR